MKNKTGIWIDSVKAVIVSLDHGSNHSVKTIFSSVESRVRIPGETNETGMHDSRAADDETRKEHRHQNQLRDFFKEVVHEMKTADEIVVFGPAEVKTELGKFMEKDNTTAPKLKGIETADKMTENQTVAWVKKFYAQA